MLEVLGGLRAPSSHRDEGSGAVGRGRQPEGAGLKSPRSAREAVSAPWKQVWLCGKCFLVISLPWLFALQAFFTHKLAFTALADHSPRSNLVSVLAHGA